MKKKVSQYVYDRIGRTKNDFQMQTFRCGGPGGQNINKVNSGVRLTDKKTGLSAEGREERDQLQNRKNAFLKLVDLLIEHYQKEELLLNPDAPKRDKVVRHYNEKSNRVKDERVKGKEFDYNDILDGKLEPLMNQIIQNDRGEF